MTPRKPDPHGPAWAAIWGGAASALDVPPVQTVSEVAHEVLFLPGSASVRPGYLDLSITPWLREPMDRLSSHDPTRRVVLMWAAQTGKTLILIAWGAYGMIYDASPTATCHPTEGTRQSFLREKLNPILDASPRLSALVIPRSTRTGSGSTSTTKVFPGGFWAHLNASSATEMRSHSVQKLGCDEIDGYPLDVDGEGDPLELVVRRQASYEASAKTLLISTPTLRESSRIWQAYAPTERRCYFVPCPRCGQRILLLRPHLHWERGAPHAAVYRCQRCGQDWPESLKPEVLAAGVWAPTAEPCPSCQAHTELDWMGARWDDAAGRWAYAKHTCAECEREWVPEGRSADPLTTGYWINGLYRPFGWRGWGAISTEWVQATRARSTERLKTLVNTDLAELWEDDDGETVDDDDLLRRREQWSACAERVCMLTAGVDVQADRLECEVVAWAPDYESWSLGYRVIPGDPHDTDTWSDLDSYLATRWPHPRLTGGIGVSVACVDAGFLPDEVYAFVSRAKACEVHAIKGKAGQRDLWPRKATKAKGITKTGTLWVLGVDTGKRWVYDALKICEPGPRYCHFPADRDIEYFRNLTSNRLERRRTRTGQIEIRWILPGGRHDEALDCRVYALAALRAWERDDPDRLAKRLPRLLARGTQYVTPASAPGHPSGPRTVKGWGGRR